MINAAPVTEMVPVAAVIEIVPLAPVSEMVEEDIAVAHVSEIVPVVPVAAVAILHDCNNVAIENPKSFICYAISAISFLMSIESYRDHLWHFDESFGDFIVKLPIIIFQGSKEPAATPEYHEWVQKRFPILSRMQDLARMSTDGLQKEDNPSKLANQIRLHLWNETHKKKDFNFRVQMVSVLFN
jgi:hypothetical protein